MTGTRNRRPLASCRQSGSISAASGAAHSSATTPMSGITSRSLNCVLRWRRAWSITVSTISMPATLRLTVPRAFTREASRYVFDQTAAGQRRWNGLSYLSKHGDDLRNWAVSEPAAPDVIDVTEFNHDDRDLITALALHDLTLE